MSKIVRLQAENFKKLRVVDVAPGGGVVAVRGRNAQGKSSTLDAIVAALGGKRVMPSRPVRAGEDEGAIRLELDNGTVILRRFTSEGGDTLEVTNGEGFKAGSPQKMLDTLYTSVAFDPLAFTRLEPRDQLARLRGLVQLDVDVDALERANKADFEKRAEKNREAKTEGVRLLQMPTFADAPEVKADEAAFEQRIASAAETNGAIERRSAAREQAADRVAFLNEQIVRLERELTEHKDERDSLANRLAGAEPLPEPIDVSDVQAQLRAAREDNRRVDANAVHRAQKLLVERLEVEAATLTGQMDERRAAIAEAMERADMPVPGLGFGDGGVLFNGIPLEQASSAERLRVSTAIGMAQAPKLRVMLVRDGSLLDDEGERILAELAEAQDFQLWVEAVDTSGKVGIVLEDGAVVAIDGEPADEPEAIGKPRRRARKSEAGGEPETVVGPAIGQGEVGGVVPAASPAQVDVEASLDSGRGETFTAEPARRESDLASLFD